jgi:hypothetical protein
VSTLAAPASVGRNQVAQTNRSFYGLPQVRISRAPRGNTTGRLNGASLSQNNLAGPTYMDATANGTPGWTTYLWRIGMIRWREGPPSGLYLDLQDLSPTDLSTALT